MSSLQTLPLTCWKMAPRRMCVMYLYRLMRPLLTFVPNQLANNVLQLSTYLCDILRPRLLNIPPDILSLPPHLQETQPRDADGADKDPPAPIIPIMTSQPRPLS